METLDAYRQIIQKTLAEYAAIPYAHGNIQSEVIADVKDDHYLLLTQGWQKNKRVHGCLVHIDITDGKVWIQRDGTEQGVANELVAAGIPKNRIVLGFQPAEIRPHTEFAV